MLNLNTLNLSSRSTAITLSFLPLAESEYFNESMHKGLSFIIGAHFLAHTASSSSNMVSYNSLLIFAYSERT